MAIFVDTSALYALVDEEDAEHTRARIAMEGFQSEDLVTHTYAILETFSLVDRRMGRAAVHDLNAITAPISVALVERPIHDAAFGTFLARESSRLSLVDLVSFEFMRRGGITRAFAFDRDFTAQGFEVVPA